MPDYIYVGGMVLPIGTPVAALSVDNISALRALSQSTQPVTLRGHTAVNDGGQGTFVWSTVAAADDGGCVLNVGGFGSSSGGYRRVFTESISVLWYGADPTGVSDSAPAINTALAQTAVLGCGKVLCPLGTYLANSASITIPSDAVLWGDGWLNTRILGNVAGPCVLVDGKKNWGIRNIQIASFVHDALAVSVRSKIDNYGGAVIDVWLALWGSGHNGLSFYLDSADAGGHQVFFPRFRGVDVFQAGAPNAGNCIGVVHDASANNIIGLSWDGGRISGAAAGFKAWGAIGWCVSGIYFDNINNAVTPIPISSVNVGTQVFTTAIAHGFSPGGLAFVQAPGITNLPAAEVSQILTTPSPTTFTVVTAFRGSFGGAYSGGGNAYAASSPNIDLESAQGCKFTVTSEPPVIAVNFRATANYNLVEYTGNNLALSPGQVIDNGATNTFTSTVGSAGYINNEPASVFKGGVGLINETILSRSQASKKANATVLVNGANNDIGLGGAWNAAPAPYGCLYISGPSAGFSLAGFAATGSAAGAFPDGFELDVINIDTGQVMTISHLAGTSSGGNRIYAVGSPTATAARFRYISAANANPAWDAGNGVWMLIGKI